MRCTPTSIMRISENLFLLLVKRKNLPDEAQHWASRTLSVYGIRSGQVVIFFKLEVNNIQCKSLLLSWRIQILFGSNPKPGKRQNALQEFWLFFLIHGFRGFFPFYSSISLFFTLFFLNILSLYELMRKHIFSVIYTFSVTRATFKRYTHLMQRWKKEILIF